MTLTEAQALTPEQKRVKLAELLGIEILHPLRLYPRTQPMGRTPGRDWFVLPDYPNDLNAVAEARRELGTPDERIQFAQTLAQLLGWPMVTRYELIDASADIQATALILTLSADAPAS